MENNQFNQNTAQPAQSQSNFAVPQGDNQVTNPIQQSTPPVYQPPVTYGAPVTTPNPSSIVTGQSSALANNLQSGTPESVQPSRTTSMPNQTISTSGQVQQNGQLQQSVSTTVPVQQSANTKVAPVTATKKPLTTDEKRTRMTIISAIVIAVITLSTVIICAFLFASV
ncbi:MAG: hypothetical protein Q3996_02610 [Candidatus Saccharibacteria bacterium]|nr:hypothetical protein [Candidatus Saccharibacteria bacterium]